MRNEMKKLGFARTIIIFTFVSLLLNFLMSKVTVVYNESNWRRGADAERAMAVEMLSKDDLDAEAVNMWNNVIQKIDYCIENDIPYDVMNMVTYASNMSGMETFLYLILVIFISRIISIEDKNKTWKNMFCTPVSRKKIVFQKLMYAFLLAGSVVGVFTVINIVIGIVRFGMPENNLNVIVTSDGIVTENIYFAFGKTYMIILLKSLFWTGLTYLVTTLFANSDKIAITVSLFMIMGSELISDLIPESVISPFTKLSESALSLVNEFGQSLLILTAYSLIFFTASVAAFRRKV